MRLDSFMMNNSTNYKRLKANLEYLKMNQMINHLDDVIDFINTTYHS